MTKHPVNTASHQTAAIRLTVPKSPLFRWVVQQRVARSLHVSGGPGSGKSTLMALIALIDYVLGRPVVIFDPNGGTIDMFLAALSRLLAWLVGTGLLSRLLAARLLNRVTYVDMSATQGFVHPFPLYTPQAEGESPNQTASRLIDVIAATSPQLAEAPVMGLAAVEEVGRAVGILMAVLGLQAPEALDLLDDPLLWRARLEPLLQHPDYGVRQAARFFTRKPKKYWYSADWQRRKQAFERELRQLIYDNPSLAMFGASEPGVVWQRDLEQRRQIILLDFRHEQNRVLRRFKMQWGLTGFLDFVRMRGRGRDNLPINLTIDEIVSLYNMDTATGSTLFASLLDELINQLARDFRINLTLAHQFPFQIDERSLNTLLAMSSQALGLTPNAEDALGLSQQFFKVDPWKVKRWERVWMAPPLSWPPLEIDRNPVELSVEEQQLLGAYQFQDLDRFQFQCKLSAGEGRSGFMNLELVDISKEAQTTWAEEKLIATLRHKLLKQSGKPVDKVVGHTTQRLEDWPPAPAVDNHSAHPEEGEIPEKSEVDAVEPPVEETEPDAELSLILRDVLDQMAQEPLRKTWRLPFEDVA